MIKKIFIFLFSAIIFFNFATISFAKPTSLPSLPVTPVASPVDSFSMFWPMSAGKTMDDKLYFLKTLKENVRGFFIFGSAQKSNYKIFLSIKRVLESESLMKQNKNDLANKTLDVAANQLQEASTSIEKAKNSSDIDKSTKDEINTRVSNLEILIDSLIKSYPQYTDKLQGVVDKLKGITV